MVMVVLGGMGSLFGPVIGAIVFLMLEEFLSQITEYWALIMGPLLLLIVLFGRGGIMGVVGRLQRG
jgi:branched-chain amino acid transport system permease protein